MASPSDPARGINIRQISHHQAAESSKAPWPHPHSPATPKRSRKHHYNSSPKASVSPASPSILALLLSGNGCWRRWRWPLELLHAWGIQMVWQATSPSGTRRIHIHSGQYVVVCSGWARLKIDLLQNPLAVHFALLKASDMILVNYEGVPIGGTLPPTRC